MKYSRHDEAQADEVGAIIMYKAGYDPRAMAEFFQKLEKVAGNGGPQFLSDHPNPGNRVEAVQKAVAQWPNRQYVAANPAFQQIKHQAKGIKAYNAQQISEGGEERHVGAAKPPKRSGAARCPIGGYFAERAKSACDDHECEL